MIGVELQVTFYDFPIGKLKFGHFGETLSILLSLYYGACLYSTFKFEVFKFLNSTLMYDYYINSFNLCHGLKKSHMCIETVYIGVKIANGIPSYGDFLLMNIFQDMYFCPWAKNWCELPSEASNQHLYDVIVCHVSFCGQTAQSDLQWHPANKMHQHCREAIRVSAGDKAELPNKTIDTLQPPPCPRYLQYHFTTCFPPVRKSTNSW